jgi:hypothetical protein
MPNRSQMRGNRRCAAQLTLGVLALTLAALPVAAAAVRDRTAPAAAGSPEPVVAVAGADRPASTRPDLKNPRRNLPPHPNYIPVCVSHGDTSAACIKSVLAAIRHARKVEHVKAPTMILPRNFGSLNASRQTFVVTDLERVARGRRPFPGMTAALDHRAHAAAVSRRDPTIPASLVRRLKIERYGSIWAGDLGPLASDYDWMYNDGYSAHHGINLACTTPSSSGCWGHRDNIIGGYGGLPTLMIGAGTGKPAGASLAEVLAASSGKAPRFVYTWKQALAHGANGHPVTHG